MSNFTLLYLGNQFVNFIMNFAKYQSFKELDSWFTIDSFDFIKKFKMELKREKKCHLENQNT